ncbi:carboxylesterase family protein [Paenibacillus sp. MER 99-2]|uniref:carboxylesterase/lipase family protein n=1 Tax=Paenibacillus sp. MER 99-2 TaxID=2939572 RepID=UPI00203C9466|nr:carboxylesterase family protein [Paenibacillus sp. MER 99-2]MCM3171877.1 carboxylesterase family protein [Paenibacillus sp. MER 99-2]
MIVHTESGKVRGMDCKGIYAFRGIPYAASTGGKGRFKPPEPAIPWSDIRECSHPGFIAPQRKDEHLQAQGLVQSEDCLNLNVWTSGAVDQLKPVLLSIHGGGFTTGTGADSDGSRYVVEDGLVYVSINYRLGLLGFMHLGDILGEGYNTSGNNGMLDIVFALQWVQRNISAFGGDPSQVTIMGASAGAKCIATLYTMERAHGLFNRAIAQSGATQAIRDTVTAHVTTRRIMEQLDILNDPTQLLELPFEQLIEAQCAVGSDTSRSLHMFGPVADGSVIPLQPMTYLTAHDKKPPLLIGTNEDESAIFIHNDRALQSPDPAVLEHFFGLNAAVVSETYQSYSSKMPAEKAWSTVLTEHLYTIGAIQFAEALSAAGNPVWMYQLRSGGVLGATHGYEGSLIQLSDPPPVFRASDDPHSVPPEQYKLARNMRKSWLSFIQEGDPNGNALPEWPMYMHYRSTMLLDEVSYVQVNPPLPIGMGIHHQVWRMSHVTD